MTTEFEQDMIGKEFFEGIPEGKIYPRNPEREFWLQEFKKFWLYMFENKLIWFNSERGCWVTK